MTGDIKKLHCTICNKETVHEENNWRARKVNGFHFHLDKSNQDCLKRLIGDFVEYVIDEEDGDMKPESPIEFFKSDYGVETLMDMFANTVKSMKCSECSHLILLPKLP